MKKPFLLLLSALLLTVLSACEQEGCTDPEALNFNVVADKDDNSCVYCNDTQRNQLGEAENIIIDGRWGTEYFEEPIINVKVLQHDKVFVYTDCGQSGCFIDVRITNIIDKEISQLQFFSSFPNTNGFSYSYNQFNFLTLAPGQDTLITNVLIAQAPQQYWPIIGGDQLFGSINFAAFN